MLLLGDEGCWLHLHLFKSHPEVILQVKTPEPFTPSQWECFCGGFGTRHPQLQQLGAGQLPTLVPVLLARGLHGSAPTTGSPQRAAQAVQPAASAIWRVTTSCCDISFFFFSLWKAVYVNVMLASSAAGSQWGTLLQ